MYRKGMILLPDELQNDFISDLMGLLASFVVKLYGQRLAKIVLIKR